jgi:hypothetical protein
MKRKVSIKNITDGFNTVAENYFRAANAKGITESTRAFLESRWACYREMAVILAIKNQSDLEALISTSAAWKRDAEACDKVA